MLTLILLLIYSFHSLLYTDFLLCQLLFIIYSYVYGSIHPKSTILNSFYIYISLLQFLGASNAIIVNNSSLPKSINREKKTFVI